MAKGIVLNKKEQKELRKMRKRGVKWEVLEKEFRLTSYLLRRYLLKKCINRNTRGGNEKNNNSI